MSECFYVTARANGVGFVIWWGPTHICEVFSPREVAQSLCDVLEGLRNEALTNEVWERFCRLRNEGRE